MDAAELLTSKDFTLLIVEDEPANIHMLAHCLSNRYKLVIAKDKQTAMAALDENAIDLILLDVNLPDGNGFDICRQIRSEVEKYADVHIIFMTALNTAEDEAKGLDLGANDYIQKPINTKVLNARVDIQIDLIRKNRLLSQLVNYDGLTEIPNRRAFDQKFQSELNRAQRSSTSISLAMIDIDFFKQFNDIYGHPAGDACLKQMAWCLKSTFKRNYDFYARYGGEEFAVILIGANSDTARDKLEKALDTLIAQNIEHKGSKVKNVVSFSAGVCTSEEGQGTVEQLLDCADQLLYKAKEQGRAQVCSELFIV